MIFDRFQGDPAVKITENGATMTFRGGQPVMDQGLENAVQISLFTLPGWWGNDLFDNESEKIGSTFQVVRTIVDLDTINDYTDAARVALSWMKANRLVSEINILVTNPYLNQIRTAIALSPPGQDVQEFLFTQSGLSWIAQSLNPAHERTA